MTRPAHDAPPPRATAAIPRGSEFAHFVILDELGRGGMGVVYAAYDYKLDRKVAVKVLRPEARDEDLEELAKRRLLREAQALARLSHPNVVIVHEVGEVDGQVYLAMEYVAGGTLASWVRAEQPPWRAIVARYCAAARGLAAAHAAGLIHRDFKPANVLVGDDGRIRVTDFGLVGTTDDLAPSQAPLESSGRLPTAVPIASELTRLGDILGTPGYVAPEVYRARSADARSDQFSFCVALYEALYGEKPFEGENAVELADAQREGRLRPLPANASAPAWLADVLWRGLAADPASRHPSMEALIRALERDPAAVRKRRLRVAAASIAVAGLAALAVFGVVRERAAAPRQCEGARRKLVDVWDDARKEQARRAFADTKLGYAPEAFERVEATLDAYAARWVAMRTDACEATRVHGEQSEAVLDARMLCLDRRLDQLRALTQLLSGDVDRAIVERSSAAADELADVEACADIQALATLVPLPDQPELRSRVANAQRRLEEVAALGLAGHARDAYRLIVPLEADARDLDWPRTLAEALIERAELEEELGSADAAQAALLEAIPLAARARDDALTARAYVRLLRIEGYARSRFEAAMSLLPHVRAAVWRAGAHPADRASLERTIGLAYDVAGRYDEALTHYRAALELFREAHGDTHSTVAASLNDIGVVLDLQGRKQEALATYEQVIAIERATFGDDHPNVARTLNNIGIVKLAQGDVDAALAAYADALTIWKAAYGDDHTMVAITLLNIGVANSERGRVDEAEQAYERALAIWRDAKGLDRSHLATTLGNLGDLHEQRGDCERALDYYRRALEVGEEVSGADHPDLAYALLGLGNCSIRGGEPKRAVPLLERALAVRVNGGVDLAEIAEARLALSRALWLGGVDRDRARALAIAARAAYVDAGADASDGLERANEWLAARGWR